MGVIKYLPDLPGAGWGWKRSVDWGSLQVSQTPGIEESRFQAQSLPRRRWELPYNYLRSGAPYSNLELLEGFLNQQYGGLSSFFFRDQHDWQVSNQFIANGDGSTTAFQLQRTFGGFTEPVAGVDRRAAATYGPYTRPAAPVPQAFVGGVIAGATFNEDTGVVTLNSAAGSAGQQITATFAYPWRVRLDALTVEWLNQWSIVYGIDALKLVQVRA